MLNLPSADVAISEAFCWPQNKIYK
jgi:hypothetical protein